MNDPDMSVLSTEHSRNDSALAGLPSVLLVIGTAAVAFACGPAATLDQTFESIAKQVEAPPASPETPEKAGLPETPAGQHEPSEPEMAAALERVRAEAEAAKREGRAPDALKGLSRAQLCWTERILVKWSYDELQTGFRDLCCTHPEGLGPDGAFCDLDWPFSDVPPCAAYDDMRNGIFAFYGYPFTTDTYRDKYANIDWYVKRDDFDIDWLPQVAKDNVATLKRLKEDEVACSP